MELLLFLFSFLFFVILPFPFLSSLFFLSFLLSSLTSPAFFFFFTSVGWAEKGASLIFLSFHTPFSGLGRKYHESCWAAPRITGKWR